MKRIARWLHLRGYRLLRGREFAVDPRTREVTYPPGASYRLRIILLLHECGHVLCGEKYNYFHDPVELLHEECEAWHRGWKLAKRLGLRVSRQAYMRERNLRIRGYVLALAGR